LACLATFHQQKPEIVKALSTYKAADLAKVYAEAEKITERAKTTPNDLTLLEQAFLDFANEDNEDYHQKIALAVLIDKFDNVPGLKEALLATGAAQIYKIEDGDAEGMYSSVRAELIERVRADLGGSKAELSCNDFQLAKVQAEQNKKLAAFFANKPL
jgi:hypothetical protein